MPITSTGFESLQLGTAGWSTAPALHPARVSNRSASPTRCSLAHSGGARPVVNVGPLWPTPFHPSCNGPCHQPCAAMEVTRPLLRPTPCAASASVSFVPYALSSYHLTGIPDLTHSGPCETPRHSVSRCCVAICKVSIPGVFAPLGQRVRVRGVRVRMNLPGTVYKVVNLKI